MDWVNFREIRSRISIGEVLTRYYGIDNLRPSGETLVGPCPIHNGNNTRAFHVDLGKNLWHCFTGCKKGGNQLDLVAAKDEVSVREAALRLKKFFLDDDPTPAAPGAGIPPSPQSPPPARAVASATGGKREKPANPPLDLELQLLPDHPHILEDRKLTTETAAHFGIGYCARGILAGCIGIPIHDEAGQLVAYAGRRLKFSDAEDLGKYRFPKGFHKDRVLYNLHRALPEADGEFGLVIVEGFFSVMMLSQRGIRSVVAVMGSELSDYQAMLAAKARHVTVLFDGDPAGSVGALKAVEKLEPLTRVHFVLLPPNTEPEDCTPELLHWLLKGALEHGLSSVAIITQPLSELGRITPPETVH